MAARKRIRNIKVATFLVCLFPLALLIVNALQGHLGANPVDRALNRLGYWALVMLLGSLVITPAKALLGWTWPLQVRRMVGLFAFFYGTMHLTTYVVLDQGLDFSDIGADILKRKFITIGLLTWLLLVPLAVTSTNGWVRRLGFARWKNLHRLVYVAGMAGCVHFLMRGKVVTKESIVFACILGLLFLVRGMSLWRSRKAVLATS